MSSIHLEILDKQRKTAFYSLSFLKNEAILGGGTALSLQIAHRKSYAFDLFLKREIKRNDLLLLQNKFNPDKIIINSPDQLSIITKDNINITFLYYPFGEIYAPVITDSLKIFSIKDIALDKAYTIGRRAAWRDYVDLYFILAGKMITLEEIITQNKFGAEFSPKLFLEQLVYFTDVPITPITYCKEEISPEIIRQFFITEVKKYKNTNIISHRVGSE